MRPETLNFLLNLASPYLQAAATLAITAAAGTAAAMFNSLRHRTKQSRVEQLAWRLVAAAQEKAALVTGDEKYGYVMGFLKKEFPRVNPDLLDAALHAALDGWKLAQNAPVAMPLKPEG